MTSGKPRSAGELPNEVPHKAQWGRRLTLIEDADWLDPLRLEARDPPCPVGRAAFGSNRKRYDRTTRLAIAEHTFTDTRKDTNIRTSPAYDSDRETSLPSISCGWRIVASFAR